ncbi:fumarate hydratase [Eggerthella guodeyinii]|uniref:Fumarate hydratase n=1 Tax=Eggerthella guodeyinii TaxID=2690837 RepID=A0A6L7IWL3_9ACTN|nr:fumarate hydratase [Eggerthella guodeyinii]QOS67604.1 fumarate hydratase [Eggerthella guodeyinii]
MLNNENGPSQNATIELVAQTLVRAGSVFCPEKICAYKRACAGETNEKALWVMNSILENASVAEKNRSPLCDDTGIPHLFLEVGREKTVTGKLLADIREGVRLGLRRLPGRPMAVKGNEIQRLDQSEGLSDDPGDVLPAPFIIKDTQENVVRLHILMQGGGPAIRGQTLRVFHKHDIRVVVDEIVSRSVKAVSELGCSPCTLAIGIGRSQLEATALMTEAQVFGSYGRQSELEQEITNRVNEGSGGPMGLGGKTAVLGTFLKVGPQRASGVRIVCMRPCCCFEPRHASVEL